MREDMKKKMKEMKELWPLLFLFGVLILIIINAATANNSRDTGYIIDKNRSILSLSETNRGCRVDDYFYFSYFSKGKEGNINLQIKNLGEPKDYYPLIIINNEAQVLPSNKSILVTISDTSKIIIYSGPSHTRFGLEKNKNYRDAVHLYFLNYEARSKDLYSWWGSLLENPELLPWQNFWKD